MEKKQYNIVSKPTMVLNFQGNSITLKPYISNELKSMLIQEYVESLYSDDNIIRNYIIANNILTIRIIQSCCVDIDLNLGKDEKKDEETISNIFDSGLWDKVKENLDNYDSFREELEYAISFVQKENYSFKQLFKYISQWAETELSGDKLKTLKEEFSKETSKLSKFIPTVEAQIEEVVENKPVKKIRKSKKALLE